MNNLNSELKAMIKATNGKFFKVLFVKKDKTEREMLCRVGVSKGVTGVGRVYAEKDHLITVYDMSVRQFRSINLETLKSFRCGKQEWNSEVTK